jgi:hypothetical protein
MKITPQLIAVCLLPVLAGCHKPQASEEIGAAEATFKTTALTSISAKYPDVGSSELRFSQMSILAMPDDKELIYVTYIIPASSTTSTEGKKTTTTTKTIDVRMSSSGKVESVSESTQQKIYNVAH